MSAISQDNIASNQPGGIPRNLTAFSNRVAGIGQMLLVASDGNSRYITPTAIPVEAWLAKGDGLTDDTAAIQAAINSLPQTGNTYTSGGRIALTPGKTYLVTSPIIVDSLQNVVIESAGAGTGNARILAGGSLATSGLSIISARSSKGFTLGRGVTIENTSQAFTGRMIDLRTLPADINTNNTDRASINTSIYMAPTAGSPAIGVDLQNAQACKIDSWIIGGGEAVRGMTTNQDFSTAHTISGYFQNQDKIAVRNLGYACTVQGAVFEPLRNGNPGAYLQDADVPASALSFRGNYTGDVQASAAGSWYTINGNGITFDGGGIVTSIPTGSAITGIATNANTAGLAVHGIDFQHLAHALDPSVGAHGRFDIGGNSYTDAPTINGNNYGQGSRVEAAQVPKAALAITAAGWSNTAGGFAPLSYWLDSEGYIHLEGYLTAAAGYSANTTIATLPPGFRPAYQLRLNGYGTASGGIPTHCGINITPAGAIAVITTAMTNVGLDGLTFAQGA